MFCRVLFALFASAAATAAQTPTVDPAIAASAHRVTAETCIDCHAGAEADAGFDLRALDALDAVPRLARLLDVRDRVRRREMPPADFGALDDAERDAILAWVAEETRELHLLELPFDAVGAPTLRRLSRFEYDNTIQDLFGVSVAASAGLPVAALGHGFDNAAGVGSLSALHIEKYLDAAAEVAAAVVDVARFDLAEGAEPSVRLLGSDLELEANVGSTRGDAAVLASAGRLTARLAVPRGGRYRVIIMSFGDQAGDESPRMRVDLEDRTLGEVEVPAQRAAPQRDTFEFELDDGSDLCRLRLSFVNDYWNPEHPDPQRRDRNLGVESVELIGPLDDRSPAGSAWLFAADPGARQSVAKRSRAIATALLERAWRAPAKPADVKRFAALCGDTIEAGASFGEGLRTMLEAALVAPQFLYRVETRGRAGKAAAAGGARVLAGHEIAVRLAYFLWGSEPDERLRDPGVQRRLADTEARVAEVRRMLGDPRTAPALAAGFAAQWLELRNLATLEFDPVRFPDVDASLRESMRRETLALFETVVRENLPIVTLCDAPFTFVDARLARHYGVEFTGETPTAFVRTAAPRAGGVLGHASVLALTSNPTRTSPVKRGRWILDNLLGAPPPPPEPGADSFADESAVHFVASMREQLAAHRRNPECAACHDRMDGLGLALEGFDAIGRARTADDDQAPIDVRGVLPGGVAIEGLTGVRDVLVGGPDFVRCALEKLWVYAFGRAPTAADRLRLELVMRRHPDWSKLTFEDAIVAIVASDVFVAAAVRASDAPAVRVDRREEDR